MRRYRAGASYWSAAASSSSVISKTIPEMELLGDWFLRRHLGIEPGWDGWDVIELALHGDFQGAAFRLDKK